ncbi:uncharacterized protein BJ171DRAFT_495554 [Polychytrium aggregatum]|uniref:uncharacterized protein n=1 Tax=Polychytrium aggregatum TaxID=110093 RepID=UPI0022FE246B|nr:uncharacterized protein BJ171DRAFT_495554 [Polychytrium aggregatum]KAI9207059.1 hypothetical protein BJ171DRAFT_495554 [Polychytrium aggregatum]
MRQPTILALMLAVAVCGLLVHGQISGPLQLSGTADWGTADSTYCVQRDGCATIRNIIANTSPVPLIYKGSVMMIAVFLQYAYLNGTTTSTYFQVSQFYVTLDNYNMLTIPGTLPFLLNLYNNLGATDIYMLAELTWGASTYRTTPMRIVGRGQDGNAGYVPYRTAVITVNQGVLVGSGITWTDTNCNGSNCACIDNICANSQAVATQLNQNVTLFVGFLGTDGTGTLLNSAARDIWRLQNAF